MKTRKVKFIIMAILFIAFLILTQNCVSADYTPEGDWKYEVRNGKVAIQQYNGSATDVTIPNTINGYPVYRLDGEAFKNNKSIKSIYIPANIEEIDTSYYGAFYGCNFTKVTFSSNCKITEIAGFSGMDKLTSINIPKNVTTIGNGAFNNCKLLKSITIPSSVTTIRGEAFGRCTGLTTIYIPSNVEDIDTSFYGAFYGCNFSKVTFAKACKITEIAGFGDMDKLTSINIPSNVTTIGRYAFSRCTALKSITIPSNVTSIGEGAFNQCTALEAIDIPKSVTNIDNSFYHAFYGCNENKLVIYCNSISTAIGFAKEHNYKYKRMDNVVDYSVSGVTNQAYTGKSIKLSNIKLSLRGNTLTEGTDYTVTYKDNLSVGTAKVIIKGKGNYTGTLTKTFKIQKDLSKGTATLSSTILTYSGSALKPKVTVKYDGTTLKEGSDYTLTFKDNKNIGKATVTITGKGDYKKTIVKTFNILPKKVTGVSAKANGRTYITVKWNRDANATGYDIYMATSKSGTYKKIKAVNGSTATNYQKTDLNVATTYYFKVKAFKTVNGKNYYSSSFSDVFSTTTTTQIPSISSLTAGKGSATIQWKKVSAASGYELYMSTSKNGTYSKITSSTSKNSTISYTKSKLTKGKEYFFKVRTYKVCNGKKVYSEYSTVKSVKVK